jgi:hypothetical protein
MGLDIRLPIGLLFVLIGALLAAFGLLGDPAIYERSLGINVNLWWGLVMLAVGAAFLLLSRRHTAAMHPSEESVEGRTIEAREHASGLEGPDAK